MMITFRTSLVLMVLRFPVSEYLTNPVGRTFLGDEGAAEVKPAVARLGFVPRAVPLLPPRPEQMDHRLAARCQQLGDQAPMATPPDGLCAHEARNRCRERPCERLLPVRGRHPRCVASKRRDADAGEPLLAGLVGAASAELHRVAVVDARDFERSGERRLVELRVSPRRREAPDVDQRLDAGFAREGAQGLASFAAGLDNFWSTLALAESLTDSVRIGRDFHLAPLVPLVARADGTIVAVVSREQGQLYRLRGGRLQVIADESDDIPGQHDQGGWSQARYQRHIDKLVHEHLKGVAEELDRSRRRMHSPKIVLVCSEDLRSGFTEELSNSAREALVGWTQAEAHASPSDLLAAVAPVLERAQAKDESETIERWREELGRGGRAVSGWAATLEAASDGRVDVLLFQEGSDHSAYRCPACGRTSVDAGSCPLDGTQLERVEAGLDLAVHQTLAHGGAICAIRHHDDLGPVEGVGALLRY